jgi:hypothetical protein
MRGADHQQAEMLSYLSPVQRGAEGPSSAGRALYRYRAGIPWRDLPERFGDFRVVHTRFSRRAKRGVWKKSFEHLAQDEDNEYAMIDSTIVRAHQHSAGALKKRVPTKPSDAARAG